ncbi:MAG: hypothetical protein VKK80_12970 [Prochlorothrix sp.]|nr:hypothetical protein [Prochlorothrix sp.]
MNRKSESWEERFLQWLLQSSSDGFGPTPQRVDRPRSWVFPAPPRLRPNSTVDPTLFLALLQLTKGNIDMNRHDQGSILDWSPVHQADPLPPPAVDQPVPLSGSAVLFDSLPRSSGQDFHELGEGSVLEDRFYALLKRRMRAQIETHPPLFPWENELLEYEDVTVQWLPQLQGLQLPVALPQPLLNQLFQQCQDLVQTVHQTGLRLVRSVQPLVSQTEAELQSLAQTIALGAARDDGRSQAYLLGHTLPQDYDTATPQQQAVLTLLAAQQLLQKMTLTLSPQSPHQTQSWETEAGVVEVTATYTESPTASRPGPGKLELCAKLPLGGQIRCQGQENLWRAERGMAGEISLVVPSVPPAQAYGVDIWLEGCTAPLKLLVQVVTED